VSTPPLPLVNTDELVAIAWIGTVPGLSAAMVGTQLPPDVNANGSVASWISTGFVTVAVVGGAPDPLLPVGRPVVQVDTWATLPGSNKPPWLVAAAVMNAISRAAWDRTHIPRPVVPVVNGVEYPTAVVQSAYLATAPRRIYDDQGDYARYQADLALSWVTANDRLD
jgi:hypothetical protein